MQLSICFFGSYNSSYSRNSIFLDGLSLNKTTIFHCNSHKKYFIFRYIDLCSKYLKIADKISVIFVPFPGHLDMPLAWILAKLTGKKLIFDPFISLHETYVFDRQRYSSSSFFGRWYWLIDKVSLLLSDRVITDTNSHAHYYQRTFGIHKDKFHRVFVGAEDIFKPSKKGDKKIIIEFHGYFTQLQGAEYFVEAAKKLENKKKIEFWLIGKAIGSSKSLELLKKLKPKTLTYVPSMNVNDLARKISHAHITVGHLGNTEKALSVISNKTFHGLASKNAVIAINSKANNELLKNNENALLVPPADVDALVKSINRLVNDKLLRMKIAENGYLLFKKKLVLRQIGENFKEIISSF